MALSTLQLVGLTVLGVGAAAVGTNEIMKARERKRAKGELGPASTPPTCPEGLTPRMVDGAWECLPVTAREACLEGVFVHDRVPLPADIQGTLGDNAAKTAVQFYGFHLSTEAMEEAWAEFMRQIPGHDEPEAVYYAVLSTLMPCTWPLMGSDDMPGFSFQPVVALQGWPTNWNYYLEPPAGISDRMEKAAMSLFGLWLVAVAQTSDKYLPVDVDPVTVISDPEVDACASGDVLNMRAPGALTSDKIVVAALTLAGYEPQANNVDQIMATLEAENPLLIEYLDAQWRVSADMQDRMWDILMQVGDFPRPVTNVVYNAQQNSCPWDEKDRYTISMATLWYAAKRMAAIAELAGAILPIIDKEGA